MSQSIPVHREVHMHYTNKQLTMLMSNTLINYLPPSLAPIIVLCIGTDRSTGDSLGPLTGTLLSNKQPRHLAVYGTLHQPVHAMNLQETIHEIDQTFSNPYIIAVDAALGKTKSIGHIITHNRPIQPGAALNKDLPAVGDAYITGVVNVGGVMEYAVLQSTRLSTVYDMAEEIASILYRLDRFLHPAYLNEKSLI